MTDTAERRSHHLAPCQECGTEDSYDKQLAHLRICFWCAELHRSGPTHRDNHAALHGLINAPEPPADNTGFRMVTIR